MSLEKGLGWPSTVESTISSSQYSLVRQLAKS